MDGVVRGGRGREVLITEEKHHHLFKPGKQKPPEKQKVLKQTQIEVTGRKELEKQRYGALFCLVEMVKMAWLRKTGTSRRRLSHGIPYWPVTSMLPNSPELDQGDIR